MQPLVNGIMTLRTRHQMSGCYPHFTDEETEAQKVKLGKDARLENEKGLGFNPNLHSTF